MKPNFAYALDSFPNIKPGDQVRVYGLKEGRILVAPNDCMLRILTDASNFIVIPAEATSLKERILTVVEYAYINGWSEQESTACMNLIFAETPTRDLKQVYEEIQYEMENGL